MLQSIVSIFNDNAIDAEPELAKSMLTKEVKVAGLGVVKSHAVKGSESSAFLAAKQHVKDNGLKPFDEVQGG